MKSNYRCSKKVEPWPLLIGQVCLVIRKLGAIVLVSLACGIVLVQVGYAAQINYSIAEIVIDSEMDLRVISLTDQGDPKPELIVLESSTEREENYLSKYSLQSVTEKQTWVLDYRVPLDGGMQLFDVARLGTERHLIGYVYPDLFFLNAKNRQFEHLTEIASFFHSRVENATSDVQLVRDLNGDELDDVMMPDFGGWRVAIQNEDGTFQMPQLVGPDPIMGVGSARYVYYRAFEPFFMDHNLDGLKDMTFWRDGEFAVHRQGLNGSYAIDAVKFSPEMDDVADGLFSISFGDSADNEDGEQKALAALEDLNGDGIEDLLIDTFKVDGLFGIESHQDVHFGFVGETGSIEFPVAPDSIVSAKGVQFDNQRLDIDGDGKMDLMVTSVDFSLGTVIRALLARSVSLVIGIYRMSDDQYPEDPTVSRKITATIDFSEGDIFVPAIVAADVTGDGLKDLLVQDGVGELKIFTGNGEPGLFEKRPVTIKLALPDEEQNIRVEDLNGDERDDLVMLFKADKDIANEGPQRIVTVFFNE